MSEKDLRDEINQLRAELADLRNEVRRLSQQEQSFQATSVQEQTAQEIQSRTLRPDENIQQFSGR